MDDISFGQIVKERRNALGLTQAELARRAGCAPITVRKMERDALRPSVQLAELLALALGIPEAERLAFVRLARSQEPLSPIPTPSPAPEEIGREDLSGRAVRGYELGERLGSGGFGVVYLARQSSINREVAVKIILPQYADHPDFIRRFEAEAQLVARLEHPHIVPLYDYWREPGVAYLVMRLLRGGSLEDRLKTGPLPPDALMPVLRQVGAALHTAHQAGVIHRDIKPANVLLDEYGNAYLADFGIAKNLAADWTQDEAIAGSPAYLSPEQIRAESIRPQADIYGLGIMLYELLVGQKPFPGPTPVAFIQQHLYESLPSIATPGSNLPPALDDVLARATAKDPDHRYADVLSLLADLRQVLSSPALAVSLSSKVAPATLELTTQELSDLENPYKGLRPFTEADAGSFFGRDTLIQELLGHLSDSSDLARFLAVIGPSGSGKSSVVKAGLVPALRRGGLPGSEKWFIVDLAPGANPWEEVEAGLRRVAVSMPANLLTRLQDGNRGLLRAARRILPDDEETELVLIIDQFEELFTLVPDEAVRAHFLDSLVTAVLDPRSRLRIIVTLRADFTDRPLQYVDFGELVRRRAAFVLPLTPDELEQAITQPAGRLGLKLEPGLVATIVRDVDGQPGVLPLLQYALTELFERRDGQMLTLAAYRESGGVTGALAHRADQLYDTLDDADQQATRQLFLRLVTLGEGAEDTRRRVTRAELEALERVEEQGPSRVRRGESRAGGERSPVPGQLSSPQSPISRIIDAFGRYRLLTFDRDPITRAPTVEVAHEALLREWSWLRQWIDQGREDIRRERLLADAAAQWETAGRDPSYLLRGSRLDGFGEWAQHSRITLTRDERAFLDASVAAREQRRLEEEARRQRELETARQLAETERQRAEVQALSAQRLRRRAQALAGALAIAAVLALLAFSFGRAAARNASVAAAQEAEAQANAELAATRAAEAVVNARLAATREAEAITSASLAAARQAEAEAESALRATAEAIAVQEQELAEQQARLATSRELSLAAINNLEVDPELSMLLALEALETAYTKEAEEALHRALQASRVLLSLTGHTDGVQEVVYSPDGSRLATAGRDSAVKVWDAQTGQLLHTLPFADLIDGQGETTLAFSDSGTELAMLATDEGRKNLIVTQWNTLSAEVVITHTLPITTDKLSGFELSPDWAIVAVGYENGTAGLWDVATAEKLLSLSGHDHWIWEVAFSPSGDHLALASPNHTVTVWDVPASLAAGSGRRVAAFTASATGDLIGSQFDATGDYLALGSGDGPVEVWHLADLSGPRLSLAGPTNTIHDLDFSPDGKMLVAASLDGTATTWDLSSGELLYTLTGHRGGVNAVAFSPDSQSLATAGIDGTARIWKAPPQADGELLTFATDSSVLDVELSPDEQKLALGNLVGPASVWDAQTGQRLLTLAGEADSEVYRVAFHPNGSRIAAVGEDNIIRVWDAESGEVLQAWTGHGPGQSGGFFLGTIDVVYSPDGTRLATAGTDGIAKVWDAATGEELLVLAGHSAGLHSLIFSPDGRFIATSADEPDSTVKVWDASTGAEIYTLVGHSVRAWGLAFTPDGRRLATSGTGGEVKLWDMVTGQELYTLPSQGNTVTMVLFTPDGQKLITSGGDAVRIWDASSGTELLTLAAGRWGMAITQDGRRLYAGFYRDGMVRLYTLLLEDTINLARARLTRSLTETECRQYLHLDECPRDQ